jgi:hypothetical protein
MPAYPLLNTCLLRRGKMFGLPLLRSGQF